MFCKKYGIELDSSSYVRMMNFFDYIRENKKEANGTLDEFRKKIGQVGILRPSTIAYGPKNSEDLYDLSANDVSDYEMYWKSIERSVKDGKDYLFDLVKDKNMVFDPNVEY